MVSLNREAAHILDAAKRVLGGLPAPAPLAGLSERVIETPWVASHFAGGERVLDVGFTMSSLDYLGLLLELRRTKHVTIDAVDIVTPQRVAGRYPEAWRDDVFATPITIGDVRSVPLPAGAYDVVTCISTIEHIGFDQATQGDLHSAFVRSARAEDVVLARDPRVNERVLAQFWSALRPGGLVLLSVPMGRGGAVVLQDSLGLYCAQWEYDAASWQEIVGATGFELVQQRFSRLDPDGMWVDVAGPQELVEQSSALRPHAAGCALATLRRVERDTPAID